MFILLFPHGMLCSQASINEARVLRKQNGGKRERKQGGNCQTFSWLKQKETLQ